MEDVYACDKLKAAYLIGKGVLTHASLAIRRSRHILVALGEQHIDVRLGQSPRTSSVNVV